MMDRQDEPLSFERHIWGVAVGSGRHDRTVICQLKHFRQNNRVFVLQVKDFYKHPYPDEAFLDHLDHTPQKPTLVVDGPLTWPSCATCGCSNRSVWLCPVPTVKWMVQEQSKLPSHRPLSGMAPYLIRPVEYYLNRISNGRWHVDACFGANVAFKAVRIQYWKRRLPSEIVLYETFVSVAVFLLAMELGMTRTQAGGILNLAQGVALRQLWIEKATQRWGLFIYESDLKLILENPYAFRALVAAITGYVCLVQNQIFDQWPMEGLGEGILLPSFGWMPE